MPRPSLSSIFGVPDTRPPLSSIFGGEDDEELQRKLEEKRRQMAYARQHGDLGMVEQPDTSLGAVAKEALKRVGTGVLSQVANTPEAARKFIVPGGFLMPDVEGKAFEAMGLSPRAQMIADPARAIGMGAGEVDAAQQQRLAEAASGLSPAAGGTLFWGTEVAAGLANPLNWIGAGGGARAGAASMTEAERAAAALTARGVKGVTPQNVGEFMDLQEGALARMARAEEATAGLPEPSFPPTERPPAPPIEAVPDRSMPRLMNGAELEAERTARRGPAADRAWEVERGFRATPEEGEALARLSLPIGEDVSRETLQRPSLAEIFQEPPATGLPGAQEPRSIPGVGESTPPPSRPLLGAPGAEIGTTGTTHAITRAERAAAGLPEVEQIGRKSSATWDEAKRIFEQDPEAPRALAQHVATKPRPLSDLENDLLLHDRMRISLDHREALAVEQSALQGGDQEAAALARVRRQAIETARDANDTALDRGGSEWGRAGRARQKLIAEDYSPVHLEQRYRIAAAGGQALKTDAAAQQKLVAIGQQLEEAQARAVAAEERASQLEGLRLVQREQLAAQKAARSGRRAVSQESLDAEMEALRAEWRRAVASPKANLDPAQASILLKMAKNRIRAGVTDLTELVDTIHQEAKPFLADLEPRDVRDAISGYGKTSQPSREALAAQLREIRAQGRLVSALEDAETGTRPLKSGFQRGEESAKVRDLRAKVNEAMRVHGVGPTIDPAQQMKTSLDAAKTRLRRQIEELNQRLGGAPARAKTPIQYDAEALGLKAERDRLAAALDAMEGRSGLTDVQRLKIAERVTERHLQGLEARIRSGNIAPRPGPTSSPWSTKLGQMKQQQAVLQERLAALRKAARPTTDPEVMKLQAAERVATKSVADLEKRVAAKDITSRSPISSRWSPKLGELRQQQMKLREQLQDLRDAARPVADPEAARLKALKARLAKREEELTAQIQGGDFTKKARKPLPADAEALAAQGRVNALKRQADGIIRQRELANRGALEKGMDWTAGWGRFLKLTGVATLQKISAAATERALIFKPIEEFIGGGESRLPLIKHFAAEAKIEGGGSISAIAKSYSAFFGQQARDEMVAYLRGGEGPLELAMGKAHPDTGKVPPWMEYPGKAHGALKAPAKIAAYQYAMEKQAQWYLKKNMGEELLNPLTQAEMKARAWEYAKRDIFMGDNALVRSFRKVLGDEPGQSMTAKAGRTVGKIVFPIVRVPTNYALEATDYALGLPKAGIRMANVVLKGSQALEAGAARDLGSIVREGLRHVRADEADLIMRQLKKGSLGAGLIALGATGVVEAGGYYEPGEHRQPGELQPGEVRIAGVPVPHLFLHHPAVEALQIGAAIHRERKIADGLSNAAWGVGEQVPFFEEPISAARTLRNDPTQFFGSMQRGMTIPPDIQRLARVLDQRGEHSLAEKVLQEAGWMHIEARRRKARGGVAEQMLEEEMLGVPLMRQNVH